MSFGPEITVVIPTRNRWERLERTLRSVSLQEDVALELILVDDGSDTEPPERIRDAVSRLGRIVRVSSSGGVSAARNEGITLAQSEWIAFLDDDDVWSPTKLRRQLDVGVAEDATFVFSSVLAVDDNLEPIAVSNAPAEVEDIGKTMFTRNPILAGPSNVIARTHALRETGGFDPKLGLLADWDLWIRLVGAGSVATCPEILVGYVLHSHNWIVANSDRARDELEYLVKKHESARVARGVDLDLAWYWEYVADGHRRAGRRWRAAASYVGCGLRYRRPAAVGRGVGLLLGEWALSLGRRLNSGSTPEPVPDWLALYRAESSTAADGRP